jgi:Tetratricopeptide repeat
MEHFGGVLEVTKRTLGGEHADTLATMGDLARSYRDLGRRQEAVGLCETVLEAMERTLGEERSETLTPCCQ